MTRTSRISRGMTNYHSGAHAEGSVARDYGRRGKALVARRWRGTLGEIDLILRDGAGLVFVEVKKSRDHARALARVTRRQTERIMATAQEFLGTQPEGQLTPVRFDVATVDARGEVRVVENAFAV